MWIVISSLLITLVWFRLFRTKERSVDLTPHKSDYLSPEQHAVLKAHCRNLIERDINNITGEVYPDLKEEITAINQYNQLHVDYESGKIDYIEFNRRSSKLVEKINISDLVK